MIKYFYVCDRKKCEFCEDYCKYTTDIMHAKNYDKVEEDDFNKVDMEVQGKVVDTCYYEKIDDNTELLNK